MTTGTDWVEATRRNLQGAFTDQRVALSAPYVAGSGTISFVTANPSIALGASLSIGLNNLYVTSANQSALTATVIGGQNGSTDSNAASGTLLRINPQFTDFDIWTAIGADLSDLSSPLNGLYSMQYTDFTYQSNIVQYDLGSAAAANLIDVYELRHQTPGNFKDFGRLAKDAWVRHFNAFTSDIPSGMGIEIVDPSGLFPSYKVRAYWMSGFVTPATPQSDASLSLLPTTAYDLPPIGAAIKIMAGREIMRNSPVQAEYRRASEVPAGAVTASANGLKQLRQSRIDAEAARLQSMYPAYRG